MIALKSVHTFVYRYPLKVPVKTSFGAMHDRPMVLVQIIDNQGNEGWGEIWCNFPNVGAEHRARLVDSIFKPILLSKSYDNTGHIFSDLTEATKILGIQTGEYGPLAQCIAGIDIATHDLVAKQKGLPIWRMLGGDSDKVLAYASGINPTQAKKMGTEATNLGFSSLKLKIGFGNELDFSNLAILREIIGDDGTLMADANQAWTLKEAMATIPNLKEFNLKWLEEPIPANLPSKDWKELRNISALPLAAGENMMGKNEFEKAIDERILSVIQPDLAKWGGVTHCVLIARKIIKSGLRYCPHYLGGGIGLLASAHALAAAGGDGILEIDINENPLRTDLIGSLLNTRDGTAILGHEPGLGLSPNLGKIEKYRVTH